MRYTGDFIRRWAPFELVVGRSWRADETYIKVSGGWVYLYRAVDERGRTVASYLSRTRDQTAARTFFRQALKLHGERCSTTLDGFEPKPLGSAPDGYAEGVQLPLGQCGEDPMLQILEQYRGAGSQASKIPGFSDAGLQVVPECPDCDRRN